MVQIFDSWAAQLSPLDFDVWCAPYLKHIIAEAKKVGWDGRGDWALASSPRSMVAPQLTSCSAPLAPGLPAHCLASFPDVLLSLCPLPQQCPDLPIILYISNSGALVERMAACNPDVISLCHTVDMKEGIQRAGTQFAYQVCKGGRALSDKGRGRGSLGAWEIKRAQGAGRCGTAGAPARVPPCAVSHAPGAQQPGLPHPPLWPRRATWTAACCSVATT